MADEVSEVLAETPAPAEQATDVVQTTETPAPVEPEKAPEPPKTFTQEELDAAIGKRLAREQRKWEREQAQRIADAVAKAGPKPADELKRDQFESDEAYTEALATRKAEQMIEARERQRAQSETLAAYHDREEEARGKYDDFERVAYNPKLTITSVMAETIQGAENGPDVAYYLGMNPKEAERISKLSPFLQAKEIGRLEVKVASDPPVKKTSSAPAPINPVMPSSAATPAYDTTDPRSIKTMSTSEWIAAERQRQIKKAEAQRHR